MELKDAHYFKYLFPSEWLWMAVLTGVIVILSAKAIWIAPVPGLGVIPDNKSCRNSYWFKAQSELDAGFTCNTVMTDYERQFFCWWASLKWIEYIPLFAAWSPVYT